MARYNITIQQNASWELNVTVNDSAGTPVNLTGWTGQSQIKSSYGSSTVLASPTITITNAATGKLKISLTEAQTETLTATTSRTINLPVWDALIANSGETVVLRILEGTATVTPGVTVWS
jgi:hypothetical protein